MPAAFQLENVTLRFGSLAAVDNVSLSIEPGEQVAFIGPSGSGKTTLIRLLNTMRRQDEGSLSVFGENVSEFSDRRLRELRSLVATIPQHLGLVLNLTSLQNVILGKGGSRGTLRSIRDLIFPAHDDQLAVHEILDRVGIEEKLFERISNLSGGQQQRVAIARALFQEPKALLADEPVSSVDPARARDTVKLLTELSKERGFTLGVSLHHLELAREFFPRLVGMRNGKVVFDGAPESLSEEDLEALYELSDEEMMEDA
ncbi:MAG: phosphonate ABC transporter ATP-binding protein [Verrucomicrobiales bacterium]